MSFMHLFMVLVQLQMGTPADLEETREQEAVTSCTTDRDCIEKYEAVKGAREAVNNNFYL